LKTHETHETHENTLSKLIRERRRELFLSVRAASAKAGISEFRWTWIERAAEPRLPEPDAIAGMAWALNLRVSDLLCAAGYECGPTTTVEPRLTFALAGDGTAADSGRTL
jgi:hypothetical protein